MGRNTFLLKKLENMVGHAVVDHTLAHDGSFLLSVEGRCIILIINDHHIRVICCKYLLCLSFVKLLHLFHGFLHSASKRQYN